MTLYTFLKFIHVLSAMAVCGALAIEGAAIARLHRATGPTDLRDALNGFRLLRILMPLTMVPTVISGMYLVRTAWSWRAPWITVALASLVLVLVAGVTTTARSVAHVRKAQQGGHTRDWISWPSFVMRAAIFAGIVFLMTVKPGLRGSLAAIGVAAAGGLLASLGILLRGSTTSILPQSLLARVTWYALAVLLLTTIHHVYGAYVYHTPWRLHAASISGVAAAVILGSLFVLRRGEGIARQLAFWTFTAVTLVIPVGTIGLFEGGYNHVVKDALYFAGASTPLMNRMFPPPVYELPDDAFFEITGIMQIGPAAAAGWLLYRLVRARSGALAPPKEIVHGRDAAHVA